MTTSNLCYDTSRHAYILNASTGKAVFVATATSFSPASTSPVTLTSPAPLAEFAGLVSDDIPPAFNIHKATAADLAKYEAPFTVITPTTSVDWSTHSHPVDFAGLTYKAPQQCTTTVIDPAITTFYLNSGASIHLSNMESDFYSLNLIMPWSISGIGGSSVFTVGVGTIKIIITKGMHLTLTNVLFVPSATVHLASISALCSQSHCSVHFDASSCWVTVHNGACILSGTVSSCHLYTLSGGGLSVECTLLAYHAPTLHIWHGHLGHANYHAEYDLAKLGHAEGINLTTPQFLYPLHCWETDQVHCTQG